MSITAHAHIADRPYSPCTLSLGQTQYLSKDLKWIQSFCLTCNNPSLIYVGCWIKKKNILFINYTAKIATVTVTLQSAYLMLLWCCSAYCRAVDMRDHSCELKFLLKTTIANKSKTWGSKQNRKQAEVKRSGKQYVRGKSKNR